MLFRASDQSHTCNCAATLGVSQSPGLPSSPSPKSHPLRWFSHMATTQVRNLRTVLCAPSSLICIHPITRISSTYGVSISRLSLLLLTSVPARVIAKTIQLISLYPVWILSIYLPQCSESDHVKR